MKIRYRYSRHIAGKIIFVVFHLLAIGAILLIPRLVPSEAADFYSEYIYPFVSFIPGCFTAYFQVSVTENLVICGGILLAIGFAVFVVRLISKLLKGGALRFLWKVIKPLLSLGLVAAIVFELMFGINYGRTPVSETLVFDEEEYTYEDYYAALYWAYSGMCSARKEIGEDFAGVGHMSTSFEESANYANSVLDVIATKFDIPLSTNHVRAKPVSLSHEWSSFYIVGMYDPFLCEANVNTDYMDIRTFPMTLCHEICHAKGLASETDCNLMASLACISSAHADFRYAGYYYIFTNLYSIVKTYAAYEGVEFYDFYAQEKMEPVVRDISAGKSYWAKIKEETLTVLIDDLGETLNNAFLEANGQTGGTATYHVPENVYVKFYKTYVEGQDG